MAKSLTTVCLCAYARVRMEGVIGEAESLSLRSESRTYLCAVVLGCGCSSSFCLQTGGEEEPNAACFWGGGGDATPRLELSEVLDLRVSEGGHSLVQGSGVSFGGCSTLYCLQQHIHE